MIFTHIFRYLDDRDAEEVRRSPAPKLRIQNSASHWEHQDVRFQKISVTAPVGKVLRSPHKDRETRQGFASLRAPSSRPCQKPRMLPPIHGSLIRGEETTVCNDHNSARLPPIEPSVNQLSEYEKRSRSRTAKNVCLKSVIGADSSCKDQPCVSSANLRHQEEAGSKEEMPAVLKSCSLQDISAKEHYQDLFEQTATQHDLKARTNVKSAKTSGITAGENFTQRARSVGDLQAASDKEWALMREFRKENTVNDFYKLGKPSEVNRAEILPFPVKRNRKNVNTRNTQDAEYLHGESALFQVDGCLAATNFKKMGKLNDFEAAEYEKGRRNAICEVLEKRTVPPFGSSLYEMRQNLIQSL